MRVSIFNGLNSSMRDPFGFRPPFGPPPLSETPAWTYVSLADSYAFVFADSLDLSPWAGLSDYELKVLDSAGKFARGRCGAAGGGLSLGAELVTNPTFDTDTTGWDASDATLASVAGGQSNNCLEVTTTAAYGWARQTINNMLNLLVYFDVYHKDSTAGGNIKFVDSGWAAYWGTNVDDAAWGQHTGYVNFIDNATMVGLFVNAAAASEVTLFDEVSLKQVEIPPATGLMIKKEDGSAGWQEIEGTFDPNDIVQITVTRA